MKKLLFSLAILTALPMVAADPFSPSATSGSRPSSPTAPCFAKATPDTSSGCCQKKLDPNNNNITGQKGQLSKSVSAKPTFGKLINKEVWATIIAFKKKLQCLAVSLKTNSVVFPQHLQELNPKELQKLIEYPQELIEQIFFEYLNDTETDPKVRANVALEFLADPNYEFSHSALMRLIKKSDLPITASFAEKLGYSQEIQDQFKLDLSEEFSRHALIAFKELITSEASYNIKESYWSKIQDLFYENNIPTSWNNLYKRMKSDHTLGLLEHLFYLDPAQFSEEKINFLLGLLNTLFMSSSNKVLLNLKENNKGFTPLIWLATIPKNIQNGNGRYEAALQHLLDCLGNDPSELDRKNKFGQSFRDLASPEVLNLCINYCNNNL